ncbi:Ig-like domain-containing protein, partial [Draconibacterium sp.]|uniref:Ig-like domain-containing protein n=1 Tax=Draconibacterium sp. TaxID=1965318 RepID=UPI0035642E39
STTTPANGTTTIEADGTITYTPDPDFNGTDSYEYTVTVYNADGTSTTETTTVTVIVTPVADIADDSDVTKVNTPVNTYVLNNDTFEGTNHAITSVTNPANGTAVIHDNGTPVDPLDDYIVYTPDNDFKGPDTYQYTVTVYHADGTTTNTETATVTIAIASVSIAKTFIDDAVIAGGAGSSFTLIVTNDGSAPLSNVAINDVVDNRLTVTGVSGTAGSDNGSVGQTVEWLITSLEAGASATITVNFSVASDVEEADGVGAMNDADNVPNTATAGAVATDDNNISVTDEGADSIDILVDINLSIVKNFDPTNVPQGTFQIFTIEVSNAGPSDAVDVLLTDLVNTSLYVTDISVTSGIADCSATDGQDVECTVDVPAGETVKITVDYQTAPFFDNSGTHYDTGIGDEFYFVFVNGSVLEGSTDGGPVLLDGVDITDDVSIITSLTRNDIIFDPPGDDPAFELHLSCSDPFTDGWGQSGGPVEGVDVNWQIAFFTIARYSPQGYLKSCGNVVNDFDIPNTAYATGEDSYVTETVSDDATVTIGPGITLDRLQTNGKRLTARLNNLTGDNKIIDEIELKWPAANGDLIKVWLTYGKTSDVVWQGTDAPSDALLSSDSLGWIGGTLMTGEAILRFDFQNKVADAGYTIRVHFTDGTWLDINVAGDSSITNKSLAITTNIETVDPVAIKIYPNPFSNRLRFEFVSPESVDARIDIYDMTGRKVNTIFEDHIIGGVKYNSTFEPKTLISGMYIYRVKIGDEIYNGKAIFEPK